MQSKFTKEERLAIGKRIFDGDLNQALAAVEYGINIYTARNYLRMYKAFHAYSQKHLAECEAENFESCGKGENAILSFAQNTQMTEQA